MKALGATVRPLLLSVSIVLCWVGVGAQGADRELHWDALDV